MPTESKPIDLGALQNEQKKAEAVVKSLFTAFYAADAKYQSAADARIRAKEKLEKARDALDAAKRSVVEGARTVANGG